MTRDEAVATAIEAKKKWGGGSSEYWLVIALEALGVLELTDPKVRSPTERAVDAMFGYGQHGVITPRHAIDAIHKVGLKIVEDPQSPQENVDG